MFANGYTPLVGGVTRSIQWFSKELQHQGHKVKIVVPDSGPVIAPESNVIRLPAVHNVLGSYSLPLPIPMIYNKELIAFNPDIIHVHQPFLLGMTGLHFARFHKIPLVYTHHTQYDTYVNQIATSPDMSKAVQRLSYTYASLCQGIIAPSQGIAKLFRTHCPAVPTTIIPTGVDAKRFQHGDRNSFRDSIGIPKDAFVVGHVGRLSQEKNVSFLSQTVSNFLRLHPAAHFVVVGDGSEKEAMQAITREQNVEDRAHFVGMRENQKLVDAYHAMDVFVTASKTETQGIVILEALASGIPVVALRATGIEDFVGPENGLLVEEHTSEKMIEALRAILEMPSDAYGALVRGAIITAHAYTIDKTTQRLIEFYKKTQQEFQPEHLQSQQAWQEAVTILEAELAFAKTIIQTSLWRLLHV